MSIIRRIMMAILLTGLVAALGACVKSDDSEHAVFTDPQASTGLELPDAPRIVALGWSDGEIALSLGVKPTVVYDWMSLGAKTKGVGEWAAGAFGDATPELISAQSAGEFNYQQIQEFKPDVILNVRAKLDDKVTENLRKIAPVVTAPAGTPDFAIDWKTQTQLIGAALGKRSEADALIARTTGVQTSIRQANPSFAGKTFVYGAKFGEAYGAYLKGDARFDSFAELGFVPNPPVAGLQSAGFFAQVPVEQVKTLDARVAIFTTIGKPFADLTGDRLITSLDVVRENRAILIAETDPIVVALAAGTPDSLRFALERIAPRLAEVAGRA